MELFGFEMPQLQFSMTVDAIAFIALFGIVAIGSAVARFRRRGNGSDSPKPRKNHEPFGDAATVGPLTEEDLRGTAVDLAGEFQPFE